MLEKDKLEKKDNKQLNAKNILENKELRNSLNKLKDFIVKKYKFVESISILPPDSIKFLLETEEIPPEAKNLLQLQIIIPDEKIKESNKIKSEIIKKIQESKEKLWLIIRTPKNIWDLGLEEQFSLLSAIAMSFPLYDSGFLGALRVAEIHKSLILTKFKKYVVSYVIAGSLVRGEARKDSDVDIFVIINDTDVKHMSTSELSDRLKGIIYSYVAEASELAGVKNKLEPQIYLLTDFWEAVKDAHPVMFTFIRDGIPLYDRGTFLPWKVLLKKGKLKPSPEAINMFMSLGDRTVQTVKEKMLSLAVHDIYWGAITPSQALLMLYGISPSTPRETIAEMKKIFLNREKIMSLKYIKILEKIVSTYKDYEHKKIKEISGTNLDKLVSEFKEYLKKLKELRIIIEEKTKRDAIIKSHSEVFSLLRTLLKEKSNEEIFKKFKLKFIKTGEFSERSLNMVKELIRLKKEVHKKSTSIEDSYKARRYAQELVVKLTEYTQRKNSPKKRESNLKISYDKGKKEGDLFIYEGGALLFEKEKIRKITDRIEEIDKKEALKIFERGRGKKEKLNSNLFLLLKKELGEFEILF